MIKINPRLFAQTGVHLLTEYIQSLLFSKNDA